MDNHISFSFLSFSLNFLTQTLAYGGVLVASQCAHSEGQTTAVAICFPSLQQCAMCRFSNKCGEADSALRVPPYLCGGSQASHIRTTPPLTEVYSQFGISPEDASFPRPIYLVSWVAYQLWVYKLAPVHGEQVETEERGRPLQVGR